ncbi:MAG: hypothetical protein EKK29_18820 [Hyphomicrobiales bacterium]|nr:MAG: hypothetical protein EKK29_18820 [Hyphomicrobiales bacterium]
MNRLGASLLGAIGVGVAAAAAWRGPGAFPHAWLAALTAWISWPLGSMGLLLIHCLTGGGWGFAIRSQLITGIRTLPLLAPFLVPLLLAAKELYPWLKPQAAALDNAFYLNGPAAAARVALYLVIWFALARAMLQALRNRSPEIALERLAPSGLILLALSLTFASIDAILSLDPRFASSVFGMMTIAEMALTALSIAIFLAAIAAPPDRETLRQLGRLLLALTILWAYLDFVQLLIVWQSNLPSEASWYNLRWRGFWGGLALAIVGIHFALPFLVLLSPRAQRSRGAMMLLCGLLILGAALRSLWLVAPPFSASLDWVEGGAMLGALAIAAAAAMYAMPKTGGPKHVQTRP